MPNGQLEPVYLTFISALAFSLILLSILILYIWPHRRVPGAMPLIWLVISLAFWTAGYLIEFINPTLDGKLFAFNLSYIGMVTLPVIALVFASVFTNNAGWISRRTIALLMIIPLVTLALQWTKQFHSFMYYDIHLVTDGPFLLVGKQYGFWFWVDWIYNYILVITSMVMLIHRLFRPPHLYFDQSVYIIIAALVPIAANVIYVLHLLPGPRVDWTPCAFTITAIALTLAITRHRFLDLVPAARESAIEMLKESFIILDSKERIIDFNSAALDILGSSADRLLGQPLPAAIVNQLDGNEGFARNEDVRIEISLDKVSGSQHYIAHSSPLHYNGTDNSGRIMVFHDITERKMMEEAVRQIAYYDPLTGLANRTLFSNRAEMAIEECKRYKRQLGILIIDFDKFKEVNDTYGHSAGDQVLKGLSSRISRSVRKIDTVSRLGGDEFIVLLPEITEVTATNHIAARIINMVSSPYVFEGHEICITLSIGIALYPDDAIDLETLVKFADVAMYAAKQRGANSYCRYSPDKPEAGHPHTPHATG